MSALWPGDRLNFSIFIKPTFGFGRQLAVSEAGHIANTNVSGKLSSGQCGLMGLNERIIEKYNITTDSSGQNILSSIELGKQKQSWSDFLDADSIDYGEINILNNRIEIIRNPSVLTAFRASGKITIDIIPDTDSRTNLICEILPYNGNFPIYIGLLITALTLWSLFALLFGLNFNTLLMILFAWTAFGLWTYINLRFTKWQLRDYSKKVIRIVTEKKKASS